MYIKQVRLKNFRCFTDRQFDFDGQFIFIQGKNGIGKTSLIEALHYASYLRSFRTIQQQDLITLGQDYFFLSVDVESHEYERSTIAVGYNQAEGKQVKLNAKAVSTHKELSEQIRMITLTADDINLVSGYPEKRRHFINHSVALDDEGHVSLLRKYQAILDQRNSKLFGLKRTQSSGDDELFIWTERLWFEGRLIQEKNKRLLQELETTVNGFLTDFFKHTEQDLCISLTYQPKQDLTKESFELFLDRYKKDSMFVELATGRSGFGIHLDDFIVTFQNKRARVFASRGQQKLLVFLLKIAQMLILFKKNKHAILLLDDFLTDFDQTRIHDCFAFLQTMPFQVIITSPGGQDLQYLPIPDTLIINRIDL